MRDETDFALFNPSVHESTHFEVLNFFGGPEMTHGSTVPCLRKSWLLQVPVGKNNNLILAGTTTAESTFGLLRQYQEVGRGKQAPLVWQ